MPGLRQIFYMSRVADGLAERDVKAVLALSRRNNRMLDVTGSLTFTGRHFVQTLEGRPEVVESLLARITHDTRHHDMRLMLDRAVTLRSYPLWSMGLLYNLDFSDDIETMFAAPVASTGVCTEMMRRLKPDTVMGAL